MEGVPILYLFRILFRVMIVLLVSDFRLEFVSDLRLLRFPNRDLFRSVNGPDWVGLFSSSSSSSSIWSIFSSSSGCSSKSEINNR